MEAVRSASTMAPADDLLPEVLPAASLNATGRPVGPLRDELYKIPDTRNAANVLFLWAQTFGLVVVACWINNPITWALLFLLMGRGVVLFAILMHEAAHRLLFSNRKVNDFVGRWIIAAPGWVPIDAYRRGHMAHHREEFGPSEPDLLLYAGYPISRVSWRRKLTRDATGNSGYKNLKGLLGALGSKTARPHVLRIIAAQAVLFAAGWLLLGRWWLWPLFWFLPWMTMWRVLNRLRAVAEHGGLGASKDRRATTHHVHQSLLARFWMVPYNTGWHLAHHVDIGVPFQNLPKLHRELEQVGYVVPGYSWPSYRALWKHASSG